jgi:indole-3-glycerol phosphate synthase
MLAELGVNAMLVGEALVAAPDIAAATREVCGLSPAVLQESRR